VRATSDTSADHLATSSAERHRPNLDREPNRDHDHEPNRDHDHDHDPSLHLGLGLDRLRPVCWL
jgi:hypothetical protein